MNYRIKNWKRFQHFKDRRPPWIKLYRELLDDPEWHELDPLAAKHLVMLWLIASENTGSLPSVKKLAFRLRISEEKMKASISKMLHWLEQDDTNMISERYQDATPEQETESKSLTLILETEGETETQKQSNSSEPEKNNGSGSKRVTWDGSFIGITPEIMDAWSKAYPAVQIPRELYAMDQWLIANPTKRKKNYYRFATNWLSRKQEKAR